MREVGYTRTKLHFANSWVHKPLKYTPLSVYVRDAFRISTWSLSRGFVFKCATHGILCSSAGGYQTPYWVGTYFLFRRISWQTVQPSAVPDVPSGYSFLIACDAYTHAIHYCAASLDICSLKIIPFEQNSKSRKILLKICLWDMTCCQMRSNVQQLKIVVNIVFANCLSFTSFFILHSSPWKRTIYIYIKNIYIKIYFA